MKSGHFTPPNDMEAWIIVGLKGQYGINICEIIVYTTHPMYDFSSRQGVITGMYYRCWFMKVCEGYTE